MTLTYRQARSIVVGFGTALICGVAVATFLRGADPVEVAAIVLFLPVLVGLALWETAGGLVLGLAASSAYLAVRFSTLGGLPRSEFVGLGIVRVLLYLGLGVLGGWASATLSQSLRKLELYDEIDDVTGVGNARALLALSDREAARADRYASVFSLVVVQVARSVLPAGRRTGRALRRLCQTVEASVRTTDLVTRVPREEHEEVVVVLPETGRSGAELLGRRLVAGARQFLAQQGIDADAGRISGAVLTYPTDGDAIGRYRAAVADVLSRATLAVEETA